MKALRPDEPGYAEALAKAKSALDLFAQLSDHLALILGPSAVLDGMLNAYLNACHAYGVPQENVADALREAANAVDRFYEALSNKSALADAQPQGRA